jgi:hypothetical protein
MEVEVMRGDEWLASRSIQPSIIKIDVEGAEMDVLLGLAETVRAPSLRHLFIELHPDRLQLNGHSMVNLKQWLADRHWQLVWEQVRRTEHHAHFSKS